MHKLSIEFEKSCDGLAQELKDSIAALPEKQKERIQLTVDTDGIKLSLPEHKLKPLYIDFSNPDILRRYQQGWRKESLAKAVGIKAGVYPKVLDTTAGLGQDSFLLAAFGCEVTLIEQSPILATMLSDAITRAKNHPKLHKAAARMSLAHTCSTEFMMNTNCNASFFDVIYLDPMFPKSGKNAASSRSMQYLQLILPEAQTLPSDQLLQAALSTNIQRIVVKRPKKARYLLDKEPTRQISGGSCRFDIYTQ